MYRQPKNIKPPVKAVISTQTYKQTKESVSTVTSQQDVRTFNIIQNVTVQPSAVSTSLRSCGHTGTKLFFEYV